MNELLSSGPEETLAIGRQWGVEAGVGMVFAISGDLGAGKTVLVKGIAEGLGIVGPIQSPTFGLLNVHRGERCEFFHLDLYRMNSREEIVRAGLEEYLHRPAGVVAVEWFEVWDAGPGPWAGPLRRVRVESAGPAERRICYEDFGV